MVKFFSLQTNFCTEIEHFCCSTSAALACIWNSRPDNKCNVFQLFAFSHQRCYVAQTFCRLDSSTRGTYLTRISLFQHVCGELECLEVVVGQKKCFLRITFNEQRIGVCEFFFLHIFDFLRSFEQSNSLLAHLNQNSVGVAEGGA